MMISLSLALPQPRGGGGSSPATVPLYQMVPSRSQEAETIAWSPTGVSVSVSAISTPYGDGQFLRKLAETAVTGSHNVYTPNAISYTAGTAYTHFVDMRAGERNWVKLRPTMNAFDFSNATVNFDLSTGTVGLIGSAITSAEVLSLGNSVYRCIFRATATATGTGGMAIDLRTSNAAGAATAYAGTLGSGAYIGGVQVSSGTTLRPYQRVAAAGVYSQPAIPGVQDAATVVP